MHVTLLTHSHLYRTVASIFLACIFIRVILLMTFVASVFSQDDSSQYSIKATDFDKLLVTCQNLSSTIKLSLYIFYIAIAMYKVYHIVL